MLYIITKEKIYLKNYILSLSYLFYIYNFIIMKKLILGVITLIGLFGISSTYACINVDYSKIKEGDPIPNGACPRSAETTAMPWSDRDEHGCIGSAGYSWSETKNKCVRAWEEKAKTYPTKEAFIKAEWKTCETATDGVNTFFWKDFMASTMIGYPENFLAKWSCVFKKETKLSKNDENLLKYSVKTMDKKLKSKVDNALVKYEKRLAKIKDKKAVNDKIIAKIDKKISDLIMKYPQDIALPKKASVLYGVLEYLNLNLKKLDFEKKIN